MVEVRLSDWLAKKNNFPRHLQGEIKRRSAKAVLFAGNAVVERAAACTICGRELTNRVSKVISIGPVCGEKYGVPREAFEKMPIDQLKALLAEKTQVEAWLPLSQITIHDNAPKKEMASG